MAQLGFAGLAVPLPSDARALASSSRPRIAARRSFGSRPGAVLVPLPPRRRRANGARRSANAVSSSTRESRLAIVACPGAPACPQALGATRERLDSSRRSRAARARGLAACLGLRQGLRAAAAAPRPSSRARRISISFSTAAPTRSPRRGARARCGRAPAGASRRGAAVSGATTTSATARRSTARSFAIIRARRTSRASRPKRSASRCGSSTPAAWSRPPTTSSSRPAPRGGAARAQRRRADPLRRPHGRPRRHPRAAAGGNDVDLHARRPQRRGARAKARHDAHGGGDGALARAARRRGRRHRQCADGAVPPARNARRRRAAPAAIVGMPVGFVGAAESKEALIAQQAVPYIVVRGARAAARWRRRRSMRWRARTNERARASATASASAPAIRNSSPSRPRG